MKHRIQLACGLAVLALAGCATNKEPEFGSSVRHMIIGQKYDPAAPAETVGGVDGQRAAQAVDGYRSDKKAAASKPSASSGIFLPSGTQ